MYVDLAIKPLPSASSKGRQVSGELFPLPPPCVFPPLTLDINRATRAVSRSGNQPEAPPYSPARRRHSIEPQEPSHTRRLWGTLFFLSHSRLVSFSRLAVPSIDQHRQVLINTHTHTHTLSLPCALCCLRCARVATSSTPQVSPFPFLFCALAFPFGIVTHLGSPSPNSPYSIYSSIPCNRLSK